MSQKINNTSFSNTYIWGKGAENQNSIPKIIWSFWDSNTKSDLVELCIANFKRLAPDFEINVLNTKNIKNYIPNISPLRKDLPFAHYTDLARLELLYKYGGIWIDASTLLTENLDWVYHLKNDFKYDLLGFYSDFCTTDIQNPILETWFLAVPKNNKFISKWRDEFFMCYTSEEPSSFFKEIKENKNDLQNIGDMADYLTPYLAAISVKKKNKDFRIFMISANEVGHYFSFGSKSNYNQLADIFLKKQRPQYIPKLIKFTGKQRTYIDQQISLGRYNLNSFLISLTNSKYFYKKYFNHKLNYITFIFNNLKNKYTK